VVVLEPQVIVPQTALAVMAGQAVVVLVTTVTRLLGLVVRLHLQGKEMLAEVGLHQDIHG
jgi:hypothetical protein